MASESIGEEHLKLLRVLEDLASNDPAGVAQMNKTAQRIGLDTVGKKADREHYERLARELEEARYVEIRSIEPAARYRQLSVTEEGHQRLRGIAGEGA